MEDDHLDELDLYVEHPVAYSTANAIPQRLAPLLPELTADMDCTLGTLIRPMVYAARRN